MIARHTRRKKPSVATVQDLARKCLLYRLGTSSGCRNARPQLPPSRDGKSRFFDWNDDSTTRRSDPARQTREPWLVALPMLRDAAQPSAAGSR